MLCLYDSFADVLLVWSRCSCGITAEVVMEWLSFSGYYRLFATFLLFSMWIALYCSKRIKGPCVSMWVSQNTGWLKIKYPTKNTSGTFWATSFVEKQQPSTRAAARIFVWGDRTFPSPPLSSLFLPLPSSPSSSLPLPPQIQVEGVGSAVGSPAGSRTEPRPQTYFDVFTALKTHVVAMSFIRLYAMQMTFLFCGIRCSMDVPT